MWRAEHSIETVAFIDEADLGDAVGPGSTRRAVDRRIIDPRTDGSSSP
jgi:hypothetical protein